MKQYQAPDFKVMAFSVEDVITTSSLKSDNENETQLGSTGIFKILT